MFFLHLSGVDISNEHCRYRSNQDAPIFLYYLPVVMKLDPEVILAPQGRRA